MRDGQTLSWCLCQPGSFLVTSPSHPYVHTIRYFRKEILKGRLCHYPGSLTRDRLGDAPWKTALGGKPTFAKVSSSTSSIARSDGCTSCLHGTWPRSGTRLDQRNAACADAIVERVQEMGYALAAEGGSAEDRRGRRLPGAMAVGGAFRWTGPTRRPMWVRCPGRQTDRCNPFVPPRLQGTRPLQRTG